MDIFIGLLELEVGLEASLISGKQISLLKQSYNYYVN